MMAMVDVDDNCQFRQTHSPRRLAWSEGCRPSGAQTAFIKWTAWTLAMTCHDDSTINIVVAIIVVVVAIITLLLIILLLLLLLLRHCNRIAVEHQMFFGRRWPVTALLTFAKMPNLVLKHSINTTRVQNCMPLCCCITSKFIDILKW